MIDLIVMFAIIATALVLFQFIIGMRNNLETRRIYAHLLHDARKRAQRTFTIIIPLTRRAETIYPLMNHLYAQGYDKLQIIVVVKQTAGSRAISELQAYRRQNKRKNLRIVRHQRGMDITKLTQRYGNGEYVLTLAPSDRISPRFFEIASQVLVSTRTNSLRVRSLVRPSRTFERAFVSLTYLLRTVGATFAPHQLPSDHTIVRRKLQKTSEIVKPLTYASSQFYIVHPNEAPISIPRHSLPIALLLGVFAVAMYLWITLSLDISSAQLYAWITIGVVITVAILCMVQVRGYRFIDFLNILLFIPIAPLYALAYSVVRIASSTVNVLRRQRLSAQQ